MAYQSTPPFTVQSRSNYVLLFAQFSQMPFLLEKVVRSAFIYAKLNRGSYAVDAAFVIVAIAVTVDVSSEAATAET